jgi:hypothetical protein
MRFPLSILIGAAVFAVTTCSTEPTKSTALPTAAAHSTAAASVDASSANAGSAGARAPAQTSEERRAILDQRLNDSLESFDAQLRKEQQKIAEARDARQATVATATGPDTSTRSASGRSADVSASASTDVPEESSGARGLPGMRGEFRAVYAGDLKSDRDTANGNVTGNGAVANEISDGNDDDVVARRLRKAAEQETDPELKDKLWKEYVEYKQNMQRK